MVFILWNNFDCEFQAIFGVDNFMNSSLHCFASRKTCTRILFTKVEHISAKLFQITFRFFEYRFGLSITFASFHQTPFVKIFVTRSSLMTVTLTLVHTCLRSFACWIGFLGFCNGKLNKILNKFQADHVIKYVPDKVKVKDKTSPNTRNVNQKNFIL